MSAATTASAPRSWAASITGRGSATSPDAPGYWISTPLSSPSGRPSAQVGDHDLDAHALRAGADHLDRLRQGVGVDDEGAGRVALRTAYERHRLGRRGALVEQRRVGGRQPGQVGDDRLEVEERLEPALGDLRLVGRVGGVPGRVLQHVAADHRRRDGRVVAEPDHRLGGPVLRGERPQGARGGLLVEGGRQVQGGSHPDATGDRGGHQRLERVVPHGRQHAGDVGVVGPDVAGDELAQRGRVGGGRGLDRAGVRHEGSLRSRKMTSHLSAVRPPECQPVRSGCLRGSGRNCPFGAQRPVGDRDDSPARDVSDQQSSPAPEK